MTFNIDKVIMSKKIIKDADVKSDKLKHFGFKVYETVELGEKVKKLEKVGEMEYTPGEIDYKIFNFDDDVEMGKAIIVQDRQIKTEKFAPKPFSEEDLKPINSKEESEEEEVEEEPEPPAISEEELEAARKTSFDEGYNKGLNEGLDKGRKEGKAEAEKSYQAEKKDYLDNLQNAYKDVIEKQNVFSEAVSQLDEALPNIIVSMVTDIVGEERKINDNVVASIAKKSLSHLRELEKVIFLVHPDDVESMKEAFPDYETQGDKNVTQGSLKVSTNIGEMNFSIERMLSEFVERIHEEFSPSEEG